MSGSPVVAPAWSLQPRMSSTVARNTAAVPTIARSFEHAEMVALRVSFGLIFES